MVLLDHNVCSTRIRGVRYSSIECFMGAPVISSVFSQSVKFIRFFKFINFVNIVKVKINDNARSNKMQHYEMIWHIFKNQLCLYKTTMSSAKSDK